MRCKTCPTCGEAFKGRTRMIYCCQECFYESKRTQLGMSQTRIFAVWANMCRRCDNQYDENYHLYGARGISYDPRWVEFKNFYEDMIPTYKDNLTLERVDNNKGYSKENCVWATMKQQGNNKTTCRYIQTPDGVMTIMQASEKYGIKYTTLRKRVDYGWPIQNLFTPV